MRRRARAWAETFGEPAAGPCPRCEANDWTEWRPGIWAGTAEWLRSGQPWRPLRRRCGHCGLEEAAGSATAVFRPVPTGWIRLPGAVLGAVLRRRVAQPVPMTYLAACGVGILLGVVLQLALGWAWWGVALAFVAVVWLAFLSTALGGPGRGRGFITEVVMAVSPERGMARQERQVEAAYRSPPFPLFGLPSSWRGLRFIGEWGFASRKGIQSLELNHGHPRHRDGPELRVETSVEGLEFLPDAELLALRHELFHSMPPPHGLDPHQMRRWHFAREETFQSWRPESRTPFLPVDGVPVEFNAVLEGQHWIAEGRVGTVTVKIRARAFPIEDVELVTVRDIEPYIEGHRRLMEESRRGHEVEDPAP